MEDLEELKYDLIRAIDTYLIVYDSYMLVEKLVENVDLDDLVNLTNKLTY